MILAFTLKFAKRQHVFHTLRLIFDLFDVLGSIEPWISWSQIEHFLQVNLFTQITRHCQFLLLTLLLQLVKIWFTKTGKDKLGANYSSLLEEFVHLSKSILE